jgi:hypothetical protein
MPGFQQYEVWQNPEDKWELVATFLDFDTAYAIAQNRQHRVRLLKVMYENGQPVSQEVIAEVGSTRSAP